MFIGKGISQIVFIRRWEDSPIYTLCGPRSTAAPSSAISRCSAGNGQTVTPLRGVLFPRSGKRHSEVRLALAVAVPSRSPLLFA